jgi:hypothetical protein
VSAGFEADDCCGACGEVHRAGARHDCDLATRGRRRYQAIVDFTADSPYDAGELFSAIAAQAYEADGVDSVECEWVEGELVPAGESAAVSLALLPTLREFAWLASAAFRLTVGYGDVRWLSVDHEADLLRSDLGTMRLSLLREYYAGDAVG